MSEIFTTNTPETVAINEDNYDMINELQAIDAARRMVELTAPAQTTEQAVVVPAEEPNNDKKSESKFGIGLGIGAAAGIAATAAFGPAIVDHFDGPEFFEQTTEYIIQPGDGLQTAADNILGSDDIDIRDAVNYIKVDPANLDVLKDGLQPGDTLIIPEQVEQ